jgi:hypothetical protein
MRMKLSIVEAKERGLLQEINRLVLHPLGLVLLPDPASGTLGIYTDYRFDVGTHYEETELSADFATAVAEGIETRGPDRLKALGYIIQPLPPHVKQLKVSVLEPHTYIGGPDELDEGEELELTQTEETG